MSRFKKLYLSKILNRRIIFNKIFFEKNNDINKTIIIEGTGRSGTTWLAEILVRILKYRQIFEPFNPSYVNIFDKILYKQYIPPDYINNEYYKIYEKILTGRIKNKWVDQDNRIFRPKGRIIKSIRASWCLKWIKNNFPMIPIIFIIRHPCAVVLSRARLGWSENELQLFLKQDKLIQDHLKPYLNIISKAKTLIQKNACIWCMQNLIPLETMEPEDWLITPYELLVENRNNEIKKILKYVNFNKDYNIEKIKNKASLKSTGKSAIVNKTNLLTVWQKNLTEDEQNEILEIVELFSLDWLYGKGIMPKKNFKSKL